MPYIGLKTNKKLTEKNKVALKEAFGEAIALLPGKTEAWLMLSFEDEVTMAFHGDMASPMAYMTVALVGKAPRAAYDALTARLCEILQEVADIRPDMVYIKYEEVDHWGYNGANF